MKHRRFIMKLVYIFIAVCLTSCGGNTQEENADHADSTDSQVGAPGETDAAKEDPSSLHKTYSNERFRKVTVQKTGANRFVIEGEAQVFEATISWVVEDGHQELKEGFATADVGAPEWGKFSFAIEVEKERPNSALTLILFETSMKDGSRQHELPIPLEGPSVSPIRYQSPESADDRCAYDNAVSSLGIGLILAPRRFTLFNDRMLKDTVAAIDLYSEDDWSRICPKFFKPDYSIAQFVCTDSTGIAYQVLTDYATVQYIPKTNGVFTSWSNYIVGSFGIRRVTKNGNPAEPSLALKEEPSPSSKDLSIPNGLEMFCPMEIRGNWVKVKYDCFYNQDENPHEGQPCHQFIAECKDPLTGWLKWRDANTLLIDIFLMP